MYRFDRCPESGRELLSLLTRSTGVHSDRQDTRTGYAQHAPSDRDAHSQFAWGQRAYSEAVVFRWVCCCFLITGERP